MQLVECYWPDVSEAELSAVAGRVQEAASAARTTGAEVAYLGAFLMPATGPRSSVAPGPGQAHERS